MHRVAPIVDLVYDRECPNVQEARSLLREALTEVGLFPVWREWESEAAETPPELRSLGSPTILVDGVDVSGNDKGDVQPGANCCRLYPHHGRLRGVPELGVVKSAIIRRVGGHD
jgi:mercuric ion transport protein